ncbi:MAG: DUF2924 domain-containing protein [Sphingomonadaceae bacterium]
MDHVDLDAEISLLTRMPLAELRRAWQRCHPRTTLPDRLPRDLLVRGIVWQRQVNGDGDLAAAAVRQLDRLAGQLERSGELDLERETRLKVGTRLVREWRGRTIRVLVAEDGYLFEDRRYASLSHVASAITGTRWSGPRFFGLKQRKRAAEAADV